MAIRAFLAIFAQNISLCTASWRRDLLGADEDGMIDRLAFFPPDADVLREKVVLKAAQTTYLVRNF